MQLYFDFSAILTFGTLITGAVWALDTMICKPKRIQIAASGSNVESENIVACKKEPKVVEYCRSFFPILLIVLLLRAFLAEPFRIPSGSMKPTLLEGDFILVNKFTYGLRMPITGYKLLGLNEPQRGDVLIFRYPEDTSVNFIKRVIALPGDTVSYRNHELFLNGQKITIDYLGTEQDFDEIGRIEVLKKFKEKIGSKEHLLYQSRSELRTQDEITIPEGHYFVMGDNRDNSEDSRKWGLVPEHLILGKGEYIWFSWNNDNKDVRWKRMFSKIQ